MSSSSGLFICLADFRSLPHSLVSALGSRKKKGNEQGGKRTRRETQRARRNNLLGDCLLVSGAVDLCVNFFTDLGWLKLAPLTSFVIGQSTEIKHKT
jgi:hypothetical protein